MTQFVISVDGIPAPDLGIFGSIGEADQHLRRIRSHQYLRGADLEVVAYTRKRYRRAAAA